MNYIAVSAIIAFIETRLINGFDYADMEAAIGLSLSRIRAIFVEHTGKSLSRYILERRISYAAFTLIHDKKLIIDVALECAFSNPDSFTRAFRRVIGMNPSTFVSQRPVVGRAPLYDGIYSVSANQKGLDNLNKSFNGSMILYNVPKVGYGIYGCTPFPICLKSVACYLGNDVDYADIMVQCGAAFRLTWDVTGWFGGNVDVCYTFDEYQTVYRTGVEALGRKYTVIERSESTKKQDFVDFIMSEIDNGRPCIATGIIGPPEACIITGYKDNGQTLLGWNFFQDSPVFGSKNTTFDESGYFISTDWWENEETQSVMSVGEVTGSKVSLKEVVTTAINVLSGRKKGRFAKGINAYDAWNAAICNDRDFSDNLTLMSERMMCQGDAMDCLADGRSNASEYFLKLSKKYPEQPLYQEIANSFKAVAQGVYKMADVLGGWYRGEAQMHAFSIPENRQKISRLILECKTADEKALLKLQALI